MDFACSKLGYAMARMIVATTQMKSIAETTLVTKTNSLVRMASAFPVTTSVMATETVPTTRTKTRCCARQLWPPRVPRDRLAAETGLAFPGVKSVMDTRIASTEPMNGDVKSTHAVDPKITDVRRSVTRLQPVTRVPVVPGSSSNPMVRRAKTLTSVKSTSFTSVINSVLTLKAITSACALRGMNFTV